MKSRVLTGILLSFLVCTRTNAAEITPSHVYQKTEVLRLALQEQGLIDTHRYEMEEKKDNALRHPRHVMQKVRECHTTLSKILKDKNIDAHPLPNLFSIREVRPSDVYNGVDHLIQDVLRLSEAPAPSFKFEQGKVPDDVFVNLKRICTSIHSEIVPSDVFQIAKAVNNNLDIIIRARGYEFSVPYSNFEDKIPGDVYKTSQAFMEDLRKLALNSDFAIPGGVIVPEYAPEGTVIPQDVIALMNDALAETDAMKYTLGVRELTVLPQYQDGKTPSDVFIQIDRAHTLLNILLKKEAEDDL